MAAGGLECDAGNRNPGDGGDGGGGEQVHPQGLADALCGAFTFLGVI
ncbi:hypothetical protein [Shewanella khirikhana]|nr:hypothetical protein [Shewanella khirikhana]